jgi:hypothetical protein
MAIILFPIVKVIMTLLIGILSVITVRWWCFTCRRRCRHEPKEGELKVDEYIDNNFSHDWWSALKLMNWCNGLTQFEGEYRIQVGKTITACL